MKHVALCSLALGSLLFATGNRLLGQELVVNGSFGRCPNLNFQIFARFTASKEI